jgi:hypothetical protein
MGSRPVLAAALAGVPMGIQAQGLWIGRRQLFVRFAGPAETATMYTADALARELKRALSRAPFHSICVSGRDALGNADFLAGALEQLDQSHPVMVDTDGQRPEGIAVVHQYIRLVQITLTPPCEAPLLERAMVSLAASGRAGLIHSVVIAGLDETSDADYLQIVEQAHAASPKAAVVIHPGPNAERRALDRRWAVLLEHAVGRHADVRVTPRLVGPAALR